MELGTAVGLVPPLSSWVELGRKLRVRDLKLPVELNNELPEFVCEALRFPVVIFVQEYCI